MLPSNKPILINLPNDIHEATIYYSSDLHVGSVTFDEKAWKRFEDLLKKEGSYVVFAGDMMEYATRTSKSDVYTSWRPHEQREWLIEHLRPFKQKIACMVDGNHEFNRASKDADYFPLYDIALILGIPERYRSEGAFVDIGVGKHPTAHADGKKQMRYVIRAQHRAQNQVNFGTVDAFDGIDIFASGHTHRARSMPYSKLVYDAKNKCVTQKDVINVVCGSLLGYSGSYGERLGMRPTSNRQYKTILYDCAKKIDLVEFTL